MVNIQEKINILHKITTNRTTKKEKVVIDGVLQDIIDFINVQNNNIDKLVDENKWYFADIDEMKAKFEIICLMHGINDFPIYMNKSLKYLLLIFEWLQEDKKRFMPNEYEKHERSNAA